MHFRKVEVLRDETAKLVIHVGDWEVAVLEAKHGAEKIAVGELVDFPKRPWPGDPRSEMARLNKLYGVTSAADNAPTFAEKAFGDGRNGLERLAEAMKAARAAGEKLAKKAEKQSPKDLVGATG
jgi:hypothetical protein